MRSILLMLFMATVSTCSCEKDVKPADSGLEDSAVDVNEDIDDGDADVETPPPIHRFFVLGDTGEGNDAQRDVAAAMKGICDSEGCDFALLLGDNIYNSGVDSVDDEQWQEKFEEPYQDLDIPFYAALGNHDYGGKSGPIPTGGVGNEEEKGPIQVMYSQRSNKWKMPATHYSLLFEDLAFVVLDTNDLMWNMKWYGEQSTFVAEKVTLLADAKWIIAAGHHPYRSNGNHGNAGDYDPGLGLTTVIPILDGRHIKPFFDDHVCGKFDFYMSGHDHNLQWLNENESCGGTELIVSGAGAKTTGLKGRGNEVHFETDESEGFLYVVIEDNVFHGRFFDRDGKMLFERTVTK